jgi:hypothetical protein
MKTSLFRYQVKELWGPRGSRHQLPLAKQGINDIMVQANGEILIKR